MERIIIHGGYGISTKAKAIADVLKFRNPEFFMNSKLEGGENGKR